MRFIGRTGGDHEVCVMNHTAGIVDGAAIAKWTGSRWKKSMTIFNYTPYYRKSKEPFFWYKLLCKKQKRFSEGIFEEK